MQLQNDYEELPDTAVILSLRNSLFELLAAFGGGPKAVRTQLCLAVAALAAHMPAHHWGEGGVIQWLTQRLAPLGAAVALPCMLEMLTVLPQVYPMPVSTVQIMIWRDQDRVVPGGKIYIYLLLVIQCLRLQCATHDLQRPMRENELCNLERRKQVAYLSTCS